jgi:hypothetical protein
VKEGEELGMRMGQALGATDGELGRFVGCFVGLVGCPVGKNVVAPASAVTKTPIPFSVTSIGDYAFNGCSGFSGSLTIPSSVTTIGDYAFYNC